jgi:hypothetical protein
MCISDVRKKATLGGNQWRRVLRHKTHPIGSPAKETHSTSTRLQYEIIGNGLYSPLPIRQRSVKDLRSSLIIGHWSVTDFTSPLPIGLCWRLKHISTYDPQAYGPTPFSPRGDPTVLVNPRSKGIASAQPSTDLVDWKALKERLL